MSSSKGIKVGFLPWHWASICKITFCFTVRLDQTTLKSQQNKSGFSRFYPVLVIVSPFHLILYHITSSVERVFSNKWRINGKGSFRNGRRLLRICCDSVPRTWPLFGPTDKCCFLSLSSPSSHVPYSCSLFPLAFLISFSISISFHPFDNNVHKIHP